MGKELGCGWGRGGGGWRNRWIGWIWKEGIIVSSYLQMHTSVTAVIFQSFFL